MIKLAIIGASYLQLPLVRKANELGIETHCFAWEDGAVCKDEADFFYPISILDKQQILEVCRGLQIDAITTIATDMAVPTVSFVAHHLSLVANSIESAAISTDKAKMREAFDTGSVSSPKYSVADKVPANSDYNYPVIVKPVDRSGSRGVTKIENAEDLENAVAAAIAESFSGVAIIEEFIEGDEVSVETISWRGTHHILAITDKLTSGKPHFVELAHHQPSRLSESVLEKIKQETINALNALDVKFGAGHSEIKINSSGDVYVIEVGARMGGDFIGSHLVQLSTGYDFVKGVIDVALGKFDKPEFPVRMSSGVYFLCEETRHILPYFYSQNPFDVEKKIINEQLQQIRSSNDRSGYLIYQSAARIELNGIKL